MSIPNDDSPPRRWLESEDSLKLESETEGSDYTEPSLLPFASVPESPPASPPTSPSAGFPAGPFATKRLTQSESLQQQVPETPKPKRNAKTTTSDLTSTPVVFKRHKDIHLGEGRPTGNKMNLPQIKGSLARELKGAIELDIGSLVDSALGKQSSVWENVMAQMTRAGGPVDEHDKTYNSIASTWNNWPPTDQEGTEAELCAHLNEVADIVRGLLEMQPSEDDLVFSARFRVRGLSTSSTHNRRPDIIAVPRSIELADGLSWPDFQIIGSLKINTQSQRMEFEQLMEYARLCFSQQRDRRFVLGIGFRHTTLTLYVFDRSGILASQEYDVNQNPKLFLRIAIGILFLDRAKLGYDTSFIEEREEENTAHYLQVGRRRYKIEENLYVDRSIRGRGTVCLKVRRMDGMNKGNVCVVKDAWVDRSRPTKEVDMLKRLKECKIENVPILIAHEIVQLTIEETGRRVADSTSIFRDSSMKMELRDHHRIVMWPCGAPIWMFSSLLELVSAFLDVAMTIEALDEKGILHRDISIDNIVLVRVEGSSIRKGFLIDFDYAIQNAKEGRDIPKGKRTGTVPFMAIDILKYNANHTAIHDAESLLYVLIWITFLYAGPNGLQRRMSNKFYDLCILERWSPLVISDESKLTDIANLKHYTFLNDKEFNREILKKKDSYFFPLNLCLRLLRGALFPSPPPRPPTEDDDTEDDSLLEPETSMDHRSKVDVFKGVKEAFGQAVSKLSPEIATVPPSPSGDADHSAEPADDATPLEEPRFAVDHIRAAKLRELIKGPEHTEPNTEEPEVVNSEIVSDALENNDASSDTTVVEVRGAATARSTGKRTLSVIEEGEEEDASIAVAEVKPVLRRSKRSRTTRTLDNAS